MARHHRSAALAWAMALGACVLPPEPLPQVLVVIDTDVIVPDDAARAAGDRTLPLANFARVEILARGTADLACENCRRDLPLDRGLLERHAVSFGAIATARPADVRVRVFRFDRAGSNGDPPAGAAIDVRAKLAVATDGEITQLIVARGDRWGIPSSVEAADEPVVGPPPPSIVGTWDGARVRACEGQPRPDGPLHEGERCIPGGAFFRGAARLPFNTDRGTGPLSETRLAVVSPFYMDRHEYTVGRYLRDRAGLPPEVVPPLGYATDDPKKTWRSYCTLGAPRADVNDLPLDCITWETAKAICEHAGGRLPTETEYEYVATGRGEERLYPWGLASPFAAPPVAPSTKPTACCDAIVFGRIDAGVIPWRSVQGSPECSGDDPVPYGGPRKVQAEPVDYIEKAEQPGGCAAVRDISRDGIVGLSANMEEWALDFWAITSDPCWSSPALLRDPVCSRADTAAHPTRATHTIHGNVWWSNAHYLLARVRSDIDVAEDSPARNTVLGVGFRCVRPATAGGR